MEPRLVGCSIVERVVRGRLLSHERLRIPSLDRVRCYLTPRLNTRRLDIEIFMSIGEERSEMLERARIVIKGRKKKPVTDGRRHLDDITSWSKG